MSRMEKAQRLLSEMHRVGRDRALRLEEHLGIETCACPDCHYWKNYEGEWVDYCEEAQRLSNRIKKMENRARSLSLLILENMETYR